MGGWSDGQAVRQSDDRAIATQAFFYKHMRGFHSLSTGEGRWA